MHRVRSLGRGPFKKFATVYATSNPQLQWKPRVTRAAHLWGWRTAQSASTLGDLKVTRKRQSWNVNSFTGKEHELVEEAKR